MSVTEEDLKKLPLRAIVAFAARCARRVQPLYAEPADSAEITSVDRFIAIADSVAEGQMSIRSPGHDVGAHYSSANSKTAGVAAVLAARAAENATISAAYALRAKHAVSPTDRDKDYVLAIETASDVAGDVAAVTVALWESELRGTKLRTGVLADFQALRSFQLGSFPELGPPIDPSEAGPLGPLWPDGEPEWYINAKARSAEGAAGVPERLIITADEPTPRIDPPITLYFDASEYSNEEIAEILSRFSDLYHALSDDCLIIDRTETLDPSLVLTPEEV